MKRIIALVISLLFLIGTVVSPVFGVSTSDFYEKLSAFSNKLYEMSSADEDGNYAMSPLSVYLALAMLHYVGDAEVKAEIENFTGMNASDFAATADLVSNLTKVHRFDDQTVGQLLLSDTVWFDDSVSLNQSVLMNMMRSIGCIAQQVPFADNNAAANRTIREFIKQMTNGLIDRDFNLDESTALALINTLYFKDVWDLESSGGELLTDRLGFTTPSGDVETLDFVKGKYLPGEAAENEYCTYFYARTAFGYKLKIIVPKDGVTLKEAMSKSNLDEVNSTTNYDKNSTPREKHFTRCIFPEFTIDSDTPLYDILTSDDSLAYTLSKDGFYSDLTEGGLAVTSIKHQTVLNVNRKGIEGAAVTIFGMATTAFDDTVKIYHDFVADRAFGYIVTTPNDVVLFEGQVTDPAASNAAQTPVVSGDANGDGELNMKDVLIVRRVIAGLAAINPAFEERARISGGEFLSAKDVLKMRRIIAGLD